jgi:uncharacterized protein
VMDALAAGELAVAPPSSTGLLGHSRGGGMAVLYTSGDPRVRALVTWAAIATVDRWPEAAREAWRRTGVREERNARTGQILPMYLDLLDDVESNAAALDIAGAAARIAVPWLLVHGTGDEAVSVGEGERLAAAAPGARFMPVPETGHTFGAAHPWRGSTPELDRVTDATLSFFAAELT